MIKQFRTTISVCLALLIMTVVQLAPSAPASADERRDSRAMKELVRPLSSAIRESVVEVSCGSQGRVSLGTIVSADGYVISKRSELTGDPIKVRLSNGRVSPARVAAVRRGSDLALLKVESPETFRPIKFSKEMPAVASFLISPGHRGRTIGIGVVGASARRIAHEGRLGVVLEDDYTGRARVDKVLSNSGADRAGIEPGDLIVAVNGRQELSTPGVLNRLRGMFPGESVRLTIMRENDTLQLSAKIHDVGVLKESESDRKVNGRRNARLSGFDQAIQHDTVLNPNECGGPVLDSRGRVVGINIARAGRVVSYFLPAELVVKETQSMLAEARDAVR